ncbi:MAG: C39 family peptidase [Dehalococcoidia bacterium]|nr:C39 family peptidase [Dehalococcoidia bacterium]
MTRSTLFASFAAVVMAFTAEVADAVEEASWGQVKAQAQSSSEEPQAAGKYATVAIRLNVPFIHQLAAGGDWTNTKNCGQASVLNVVGYLRGQSMAAWNITRENEWLYQITRNSGYHTPNGWYTDVNMLARMGREFWGFQRSRAGANGSLGMLTQELVAGHPVIVAVRLNMATSGLGHFMVLTGADQNYVWVNDVGRTYGKDLRFSVGQFLSSWKTQNYSFAVIK